MIIYKLKSFDVCLLELKGREVFPVMIKKLYGIVGRPLSESAQGCLEYMHLN